MVADSVGKIQLDLEINPKSIAQEMGSLNKIFTNGMKKPFTDMGNFVKNSMARMASSFRSMVPGEAKEAPAEMSEQIESLATQMDNASNQAEMYRQRLKDLTEQYEMMDAQSRRVGFGVQLQEDMLKTEEKMLRYGERSDKLRQEIEKLEESTAQLAETTSQAGHTTERAGRQFVSSSKQAKKAKGVFLGMATSMHRAFMRVLRQVFIFAVLYKTIRGFMDYVGSALKTNEAFSNSLNQVKTNLQVAFMPIYQAVLPALQTLMHWLAVATTYIATFMSVLFGKTYAQSFAAAQALNAAKKNMEGYGKAAKKTLGALAGFDEIHILKGPGEDAGGGAEDVGLVPPPIDVGEMSSMIDGIKSMLARLFEPIKVAWANEGAATIEAAKYALGGIWALIKEIGKSFAEVWTGGTGQAILETFLRILQNIFGLIGDIGYTFANVWAEGGRGTAIVQGIANIFLHLLELMERIGESLRNVWGEVGETVARTFLDIIGATVGVLEHLAETLLWVWDHGGKHLFESLLILGAKIFELAGLIYTEFVVPFLEWFIDLIAPAIATVLDWAGWLLDKFIELIDWLMGDGRPVLDLIVTILGSMAIAFGVIKAAIAIFTGVITVATTVAGIFGAAIAFLTSPIGIAVVIIGGLIAIGILLYKNWDKISAWLKKIWENIKNIAGKVFNGIKNGITNAFNTVKTTITNIWNSITTWLTNTFNNIYNKATSIFNNLKNFIKGICDSISGFFKGMVNGVIRALNSMIGGLNKLHFDVPDWIPIIGGKSFGFNIPKIPELARGGIVDQPILAMIGEKRKKEAVVPLEQNTGWMDDLAAKIGAAGGVSEEGPLIIQINLGSSKILEEIIDAARRKNARAGKTVIAVGV